MDLTLRVEDDLYVALTFPWQNLDVYLHQFLLLISAKGEGISASAIRGNMERRRQMGAIFRRCRCSVHT